MKKKGEKKYIICIVMFIFTVPDIIVTWESCERRKNPKEVFVYIFLIFEMLF